MRERLGIPEYDATKVDVPIISLMKAAEKLGICVGSAQSLVQRGILPATQILPGSPWMVPVEALSSEAVRIGCRVSSIAARSFMRIINHPVARNLMEGCIMKRTVLYATGTRRPSL
ncbi:helix-turn-helix domain-containing protein [Rhizobium sophoriradicis]|uniref:helix-turn-helix domain-containing protein n=1 Tax=Rhizobium sophoriradicis TaxID=1535245 RepID=UPI001FE03DF6|nr:helix-turn-helix domain-containing protein [Rhizobium sophoriradicis]